jgi:hypothetical protein
MKTDYTDAARKPRSKTHHTCFLLKMLRQKPAFSSVSPRKCREVSSGVIGCHQAETAAFQTAFIRIPGRPTRRPVMSALHPHAFSGQAQQLQGRRQFLRRTFFAANGIGAAAFLSACGGGGAGEASSAAAAASKPSDATDNRA